MLGIPCCCDVRYNIVVIVPRAILLASQVCRHKIYNGDCFEFIRWPEQLSLPDSAVAVSFASLFPDGMFDCYSCGVPPCGDADCTPPFPQDDVIIPDNPCGITVGDWYTDCNGDRLENSQSPLLPRPKARYTRSEAIVVRTISRNDETTLFDSDSLVSSVIESDYCENRTTSKDYWEREDSGIQYFPGCQSESLDVPFQSEQRELEGSFDITDSYSLTATAGGVQTPITLRFVHEGTRPVLPDLSFGVLCGQRDVGGPPICPPFFSQRVLATQERHEISRSKVSGTYRGRIEVRGQWCYTDSGFCNRDPVDGETYFRAVTTVLSAFVCSDFAEQSPWPEVICKELIDGAIERNANIPGSSVRVCSGCGNDGGL